MFKLTGNISSRGMIITGCWQSELARLKGAKNSGKVSLPKDVNCSYLFYTNKVNLRILETTNEY